MLIRFMNSLPYQQQVRRFSLFGTRGILTEQGFPSSMKARRVSMGFSAPRTSVRLFRSLSSKSNTFRQFSAVARECNPSSKIQQILCQYVRRKLCLCLFYDHSDWKKIFEFFSKILILQTVTILQFKNSNPNSLLDIKIIINTTTLDNPLHFVLVTFV